MAPYDYCCFIIAWVLHNCYCLYDILSLFSASKHNKPSTNCQFASNHGLTSV